MIDGTTRRGMVFNWLTWVGLMIAALGWILPLLAGGGEGGRSFTLGSHVFTFDAADRTTQNMILSGFGLALLGALQTGFGALDRFFSEILVRSRRQPEFAAEIPQVDPHEVVERGKLNDRAYVLFADGTVEVETLLGMRRFASFGDAEGFVGR
jgi:hypothetical protein